MRGRLVYGGVEDCVFSTPAAFKVLYRQRGPAAGRLRQAAARGPPPHVSHIEILGVGCVKTPPKTR